MNTGKHLDLKLRNKLNNSKIYKAEMQANETNSKLKTHTKKKHVKQT